MNKFLFAVLLLGTIGGRHVPHYSVVVTEDIVMPNALPDWGTVCEPAQVRGGPDVMYPVLYSVGIGERVRIHDQSRPDGTWVSIKAARWVPLKSICFEEK